MNVVSLSLCYPSERSPSAGLFVQQRLRALSELAEVRVIKPIPTPPWSRQRSTHETHGPPPCWHVPMPYLPGLGKPLNPRLYARAVRPLIESWSSRGRVDVIDAHFCWPDAVAANHLARSLHVPYTVTLRGPLARHGRDRFKRRAIVRALNEAAAIIAVSESLRDDAARLGVDASRIHVIPNGVDAGLFRPGDRFETRRALGRAAGETILITVGHLCPRKGFHRVLDILPGLVRENPRIRYVIIGDDGAERRFARHLHRQAKRLGVTELVTFTGALDPAGVARWLQAADLFVLPTGNEGWCNALNEAVATGTPVVCTDVGGNREVISEGTGSLVPPGDRRGLLDAIRRNLVTDLAPRAVAQAKPPRSWSRVAEETAAVLHEAACGSPRPSIAQRTMSRAAAV